MIFKLMIVALGGSIGAVGRYLVYLSIDKLYNGMFPWATLLVNLMGALLIGFLWGLFDKFYISPAMRTLVFIGILGSFTTFSAFAFDILSMTKDGEIKQLIFYVLASNILGTGLAFAGFYSWKFIG